jgi:hypothetical protein
VGVFCAAGRQARLARLGTQAGEPWRKEVLAADHSGIPNLPNVETT